MKNLIRKAYCFEGVVGRTSRRLWLIYPQMGIAVASSTQGTLAKARCHACAYSHNGGRNCSKDHLDDTEPYSKSLMCRCFCTIRTLYVSHKREINALPPLIRKHAACSPERVSNFVVRAVALPYPPGVLLWSFM